MKNTFSLLACLIISVVLIQYRFSYSTLGSQKDFRVITWDALGYYMYLPGIFIYHDITELKWLPGIDKKYSVTGGKVYQARKCDNGNFVFKYLGGVAILETPFFFLGHWIARTFNYEADGFSAPYQYSVSFGILFCFLLSIFLLRNILLRYFNDLTTALTLLLLILASNIIQYAAIDNAQSHGPIFPLYVLVIYTTMKWHEKPGFLFASLTGFLIGLATICRPTEIVMILIPVLWNTNTKESAREKWNLIRQNKKQIMYCALFGFMGILPQLIYWKIASGSLIYDVGSKWNFLNPFFRVLIGWEKGWFIYTPVTILFVAGMFFMKRYPFRKSVLWFCLLNIYIIISWHDWRYGGSYSTRALSHSYPVFALPLAALIERIRFKKWHVIFYALGIYLICVNLFQIKQYNNTILHYDNMNRKYYARIYLNNHPTPLDMSMLDNDEYLIDESGYNKVVLASSDSLIFIKGLYDESILFFTIPITPDSANHFFSDVWLKIESVIKVNKGYSGSYLCSEIQTGDSIKHNRVRLFSPISTEGKKNNYAFFVCAPNMSRSSTLKLSIQSSYDDFEGVLTDMKITILKK